MKTTQKSGSPLVGTFCLLVEQGFCRHENHPVVFIILIAVALTAVVYKPSVIPGEKLPDLLFNVHMKIAAHFSISIHNQESQLILSQRHYI